MTYLRNILLPIIIATFCISSCSYAQEQKDGLVWYTDIQQICKLSNEQKKPVFGFFTGSDWCGWCHKLQADVFSKPGFKAWAKQNVILMELDFPRAKKLPDSLASQNYSLQNFFHVQGYPTVWIFTIEPDSTGRYKINALGSLGYPQATSDQAEASFMETLKGIMAKKPQ